MPVRGQRLAKALGERNDPVLHPFGRSDLTLPLASLDRQQLLSQVDVGLLEPDDLAAPEPCVAAEQRQELDPRLKAANFACPIRRRARGAAVGCVPSRRDVPWRVPPQRRLHADLDLLIYKNPVRVQGKVGDSQFGDPSKSGSSTGTASITPSAHSVSCQFETKICSSLQARRKACRRSSGSFSTQRNPGHARRSGRRVHSMSVSRIVPRSS